MAAKLLDLLKRKKTLIWDGGLGTQLMAKGMSSDSAPELWNLDKPDVVREIHAAYYEAGADAGQSNTFGGHPMKLAGYDLEGKAVEINREGVRRVAETCPEGKLAVGDIGPSGAMLPPSGEADAEQVKEGFRTQAFALAEGGAHILHIETMFDLQEMMLAVQAALETGLEVMASMTFNRTKRGFFTIMGDSPQKAVRELEQAGATAVGANCTIGPADMVELTGELRKYTSGPIIVQANAGTPRALGGELTYDISAGEFAEYAARMVEAGADIVGGCCGTDPDFIAQIKNKLS